jgi:hypothetical protein
MALNLASPGVKIREVDLTIGRADPGNDQVGAIVGPFAKGPVNVPTLVTSEQELLGIFGKPLSTDGQYEYWLSASNYLSYGGTLRVIRCSGEKLNNSNAGVSLASTSLTIENFEDYQNSHTNGTDWRWASRNPGSWANNLKVCVIDNGGDQVISGINTSATPVSIFTEVTTSSGNLAANATTITGVTTANIIVGHYVRSNLNGLFSSTTVVTGITSTGSGLGDISITPASLNATGISSVSIRFGTVATTSTGSALAVGYAVTQSVSNVVYATGAGTTASFTGTVRGLITGIGVSEITVRVTDRISNSGVIESVQYLSGDLARCFSQPATSPINVNTAAGITTATFTDGQVSDWYSRQTLGLSNSTIYWSSIAQKPGTTQYALERNSRNDEMHVVVVDDTGSVSGISGNILEKFLNLSKASDGRLIPSQLNYYKETISGQSNYIYAGAAEVGAGSSIIPVGTSTSSFTVSSGSWGVEAQGVVFNVIGSKTYTLTGGKDYSGVNDIGGYAVNLSNIISGYQVLSNASQYPISFILNGPSGGATVQESQAKANAVIAIANQRKDCIAVISPHRQGVVNVANSDTQTTSVINFFEALTSSSYAVFDSGYKYMFDRFNNKFEYVACNADVAGLMARTSINNFSWYSPAGTNRGAINNAVKLAYNPSLAQRDELYGKRINPIINVSGSGFVLFGDKTALGYPSAFDRINVRRLFLTVEAAVENAARAQLFEFNDIITRSNFINIVEPFLRDVKSKRGITDYTVICDETNNTPDVIDANEFRADIFIQPARSINFVGLTFVATRTGISFSEVIGGV